MSTAIAPAQRTTAFSGSTAAYAVSLLLLVGIFLGSPNFRGHSGPDARPFGGDVLQEWIGGHVVRCGDYARFYDGTYAQSLEHDEVLVGFAFRSSEYFPLVYPPFYYLLVSPLSWLPFHVAAIVWAGLMVAAHFAAWRLFERATARTGEDAYPTCWLLPLSLLFMPLIENLTTCQKGSVLLLILTGTYYLLKTKRPYWAGLVFGLIAFKPQFALPIAIAMLCIRQWRFVLGGLTTGSVLVGLCLLMGVDVCRQYVDFSTHAAEYLHNSGYDLTKSHAWNGFFALMLGSDSQLTSWLILLADGTTIGLVFLALWGKLDTASPRFAWQFSALIVATVLLSPHLYTYDLTVLLLPLGLVATRGIGFQPVRESSVGWDKLANAGHAIAVGSIASAGPPLPIGGPALAAQSSGPSKHTARAGPTLRAVRESGATSWQPVLRLEWLALLLFCLAGVSTQIAAITSIQFSVPLLLAFLWANKKAADNAAGGC